MKKQIFPFMLLAFATTAAAEPISKITEADVRNATLDDRTIVALHEGKPYMMAMIKDGLPACKKQKGTFVAVQYRDDRTIDIGCALAFADKGKTLKDGDFLIHMNSGKVVKIPASSFGRIKVSRVLQEVKNDFGPLNAIIQQNNALMTRMNVLEPNNKDANITSRQRDRMIDCMRGFAGELQQLMKISSPFSQNLYEFQERVKATSDMTTASLLLDSPTPETLRNLEELKSRSESMKQSLTRVDEKYTKCEAKYLK